MNQSITRQIFPRISGVHQHPHFTNLIAASLAGSQRNRVAITSMKSAIVDCETKPRTHWLHDKAVRPDSGCFRISDLAQRCRLAGIVNVPATQGDALHR